MSEPHNQSSGAHQVDDAQSDRTLEPAILWHVHEGEGPILGLAVHAGHDMRPELIPYLRIDEVTRIREEDPYSDYWTLACPNRFLTRRSRFEADLNRTLDHAICVQPEDCWNLNVWHGTLPRELRERSLREHQFFYRSLLAFLNSLERKYGAFVVFDFHTYNHRRGGPNSLPAQPETNPEINIGTGSMDRAHWTPLIDRLMGELSEFDFQGRTLDVRENVNFRGRQVAAFVHEHFPRNGCALAIEVKKFFMDEWTGEIDANAIRSLLDAFRSTIPAVLEELSHLKETHDPR